MKLYFNKVANILHDEGGYYYLDNDVKIYCNVTNPSSLSTNSFLDKVATQDEIGWYIDVVLPWEEPTVDGDKILIAQVYNYNQDSNILEIE